nr:hypothetical protein [Kibdelosporangium sp. MJ126-NF4]CEL15924.1 hypothetical protein [Kibdelosporangium sp. MJ126-NF4]CTQ93848.1 hypothetical protein [Kibdelosporangium sp. MJ126-NF4]
MTDELEQRLRSTLTSIAAEVPPSDQAWAELQRRLAMRSGRRRPRPVVMAAVAAAAVALIAVPVTLIQQANGPAGPDSLPVASGQSEPPPAPSQVPDRTSAYLPQNGETLVIKPAVLSSERNTEPGNTVTNTFAYVTQQPSGNRQLCIALAPENGPINGPDQHLYGAPNCMPMAQPKPGRYEWGRRHGTTPNTNTIWLYVMSRPAAEMLLKTTDDSVPWVKSTRPQEGADIVMFNAYLPSAKPAKQFTVFDAQRQPLLHSE